jgi:hypothetical protein
MFFLCDVQIHIDDLTRNFGLNPQNGIAIRPYNILRPERFGLLSPHGKTGRSTISRSVDRNDAGSGAEVNEEEVAREKQIQSEVDTCIALDTPALPLTTLTHSLSEETTENLIFRDTVETSETDFTPFQSTVDEEGTASCEGGAALNEGGTSRSVEGTGGIEDQILSEESESPVVSLTSTPSGLTDPTTSTRESDVTMEDAEPNLAAHDVLLNREKAKMEECLKDASMDVELLLLGDYLVQLATRNRDFTLLDHSCWREVAVGLRQASGDGGVGTKLAVDTDGSSHLLEATMSDSSAPSLRVSFSSPKSSPTGVSTGRNAPTKRWSLS